MIGGRPYTDRTTLIKGGYVPTLDAELGDLPLTDVLIDGDKIAAIGRNLTVSPNANVIDATNRIVMPGFVDTHRHTWQTPVRGVLPSCTLDQYFSGMLDNIGIQYRAEDVYVANVMGALECLNGGITTLLDWSHVNNTPEHADAAIAGLTEAGIRAVYAHGPPVGATKWWAYSSQEHPEDVRRLRKQYFNSDDQLLTLALAARAPGNTTPDVAKHDWLLARDLGVFKGGQPFLALVTRLSGVAGCDAELEVGIEYLFVVEDSGEIGLCGGSSQRVETVVPEIAALEAFRSGRRSELVEPWRFSSHANGCSLMTGVELVDGSSIGLQLQGLRPGRASDLRRASVKVFVPRVDVGDRLTLTVGGTTYRLARTSDIYSLFGAEAQNLLRKVLTADSLDVRLDNDGDLPDLEVEIGTANLADAGTDAKVLDCIGPL